MAWQAAPWRETAAAAPSCSYGARLLVVRLEASESAFPKLEKRVDLSLASMRFKG